MSSLALPEVATRWEGNWVDKHGLLVRVERTKNTLSSYSADFDEGEHGSVHGGQASLFGLTGTMQDGGYSVAWSNGAHWQRDCGGGCPALDCMSACQIPRLNRFLSRFDAACVQFVPGRNISDASVVLRPCAVPPDRCPPGQTISNRVCADKKPKDAAHGHWDMWVSRSRLVAHFLAVANARPHCGPRIAIFSLADYDTGVLLSHFGNASSLKETDDLCVASLTWQGSNIMERRNPVTHQPLPHAATRPVLIPDAYFLMTQGYTYVARYFHERFNLTKASIAAVSASSTWRSKRFSCVWRGTSTSDVSGDRKRLVQESRRLRESGSFTDEQLNVAFTECVNMSMCLGSTAIPAEEMMLSRGVFSVDGIGNEWTLLWKLLANSVCLLVESRRTWQWYYPYLEPWIHYVPVSPDMSDLAERVAYVLDPANDDALEMIAKASTDLAMQVTIQAAADDVRPRLETTFNPRGARACGSPERCTCWAHKCASAPAFFGVAPPAQQRTWTPASAKTNFRLR